MGGARPLDLLKRDLHLLQHLLRSAVLSAEDARLAGHDPVVRRLREEGRRLEAPLELTDID